MDICIQQLAHQRKISRELLKEYGLQAIDLEVMAMVHVLNFEGTVPSGPQIAKALGVENNLVYDSVKRLKVKSMMCQYMRPYNGPRRRESNKNLGATHIFSLDGPGLYVLTKYQSLFDEKIRIRWSSKN